MFVAASLCPHPPLLVPACAPGPEAELDALRAACDGAVRRLLDRALDVVVCVGDAPRALTAPPTATGSMAAYGGDVRAGCGPDAPSLPLALTVGAYLLDRAGWAGDRVYIGVPDGLEPARCAELGATLADRAGRVGFLALGDGSAYRAVAAPGPLADAATAYDTAVTEALATADAARLLELSAERARTVVAHGRAAQQVAAGALRAHGEDAVEAALHYAAAPYGVSYAVATWTVLRGSSASPRMESAPERG